MTKQEPLLSARQLKRPNTRTKTRTAFQRKTRIRPNTRTTTRTAFQRKTAFQRRTRTKPNTRTTTRTAFQRKTRTRPRTGTKTNSRPGKDSMRKKKKTEKREAALMKEIKTKMAIAPCLYTEKKEKQRAVDLNACLVF